MEFKERLKEKRVSAGLSQEELAKKAGVTGRTIQNYESGSRFPNNLAVAARIAEALGVTSAYLLGEDGMLVVDAAQSGGAKAKREVRELVEEVAGLFAGGEMDEEEKDAVMEALNAAYWDAKKKNKKYSSKVGK